jgi:hypothetical protein
VKRVQPHDAIDMPADVFRKGGIDLVQNVLPIEQRPHLANGLIADPCHDAPDLVQYRLDRLALGVPVGLRARQLDIRCTFTSLTRSPLIQTWRPSRIESRYCCPVRIIGVLYRLCDCRLALSREAQSAPISRGSGERLARDVPFRGILAQ